jgi:hypothetical protein
MWQWLMTKYRRAKVIQDRQITFYETDNWTASDLCSGCDLGLPPTFALGATLITPHDLVKSFEVLSLAAMTSGLPNPDRTYSFGDSILIGVSFEHPYSHSLKGCLMHTLMISLQLKIAMSNVELSMVLIVL